MLTLWTIYDHPRDFPHCFVARKFLVAAAGPVPTEELIISADLARIRTIFASRGLSCLARDPGDEPQIVESWL